MSASRRVSRGLASLTARGAVPQRTYTPDPRQAKSKDYSPCGLCRLPASELLGCNLRCAGLNRAKGTEYVIRRADVPPPHSQGLEKSAPLGSLRTERAEPCPERRIEEGDPLPRFPRLHP
jgi:hypothetical protein